MVAAFALLDSITAGAAFTYYAATCFWRSLKDEDRSGKSEKWHIKTFKKLERQLAFKPRTWLNVIQVWGTLFMFVLGVSSAIVLGISRGDVLSMKADTDVSALLFGSLVWLIWFLSLVEGSDAAGHEQYVPWMLLCPSYGISAAIASSNLQNSPFVLGILWARVILVLALILAVLAFRKRGAGAIKLEDHPVEETQPLIASTEQQNDQTATSAVEDEAEDDDDDDDDDKSVTSELSNDDGAKDDADDESDDQKEEKIKRKSLRDRPWWEYLASFKIFLPFVRPRNTRQYGYLSVMIVNVLVARAMTLGMPLVLGAIIDQLTRREFSYPLILAYVGLRFASSSSGVALIKNIVLYRWNTEQHDALVTYTYDHIMGLSADYHASKSTPSTYQILERGMSVISLLQDIFFDHLPVIADLVIALFVVSKLFGAYLCYAVALTMILLSWSNRVSMAKKTRMRRYYVDVWRNWYGHMSESFMHWRTVSEFNKLDHEKTRHREKTAQYTKAQIRSRYFNLILSAMQELLLTSGFTFVCIIAAKEIAAGRLVVGRFVVLITYWGQIMSPVTKLTGLASQISEQLVDAEKLLLLLEKAPTVSPNEKSPMFEFKGGHIQVKNCSFSYDKKRVVTDNVSFEALPGQTVALVGQTGGGKSTIFNLLFRFFDPSSGRVLVDGQDISQINLESFRAVLGLVPQNPVLFNTTIIKNVRYGRLHATKAEVIAACKASEFHDKVQKFPKKYRQKVGELSQKLSGGELQRLAIARAIIKDPGILLLDEATSAVDSVTESKIQDSLDRLSKGRTTFVIAHRLSTIMNADKILVVKEGQIIESGSHTELLEHGNGAYKELWDAQLKLNTGKNKSEKDEELTEDGVVEEKETDLMAFEADDTPVATEKSQDEAADDKTNSEQKEANDSKNKDAEGGESSSSSSSSSTKSTQSRKSQNYNTFQK